MEILILLSLILLNGVLAMSEIAVVAARKTRLQEWAQDGNRRAEAALGLAREPSNFLSTIQVGITLVGIFAGAYGEATLSTGLSEYISQLPLLDPYSEELAFGIVVLGITYFSLIIGELVPKRLALHDPELIASLVARPMRALSRVAHPVVRILSGSTELVLRLLGSRPSEGPPVSEEEIRVLMEQGTRAGIFEKSEQALVRNVLRLDERVVASLMTPRVDIVNLDLDDPIEINLRKISENRFSRYPVCRGGLEHVVGIAHTKEILARQLSGASFDLAQCVQEPLFVPETVSAIQLLETFKQSRIHAALVVDEYGELQGLVTLNDVLGAIVGEIPAAEDQGASMVVKRADGSWLIDAMLDAAALKELLHIEELPDEEEVVYHTLGGLMMTSMGRVPRVADSFEWQGYRFEIVDMDGNRVDKVLVSKVPSAPGDVNARSAKDAK
jgi:putative hemolysin